MIQPLIAIEYHTIIRCYLLTITWDDPVCWLWRFVARVSMAVYRMFLLHQRGKIQFLYVCILRRHVVTRKWLPHIWGSMAENFQRYIIKYSHSVVPGLYNWVLPPVHSQCWGESEKLDTEKQQTLYYQLHIKLTSKMNNNTIGYYSVIIQRSLLLLGGFRYLKVSSWRPF